MVVPFLAELWIFGSILKTFSKFESYGTIDTGGTEWNRVFWSLRG